MSVTDETHGATVAEPEPSPVEAFLGRAVQDLGGTMATVFAILGDRLGLFRALAEGPATPDELAARAGVDARYALEWLRGLTAAGYLEGDGERFVLPPAHAAVLVDEGAETFLGGAYEELGGVLQPLPRVAEAFRVGGGVPQSAYPDEAYDGMARFTRIWFDHKLLDEWLPRAGDLAGRARQGVRWADVGCGAGGALIRLAEAFPASTFVGYDAFPGQIERARAAAEAAGVDDRVRFEVADVSAGIDAAFDVVSLFDVLHDAVDPAGLLAAVRASLAPGGTCLLLEMNCEDDPAANAGPLKTLMYGFSVLYCMTTSLAHGGAGLGTCGCPPAVVADLARRAGFVRADEVAIDDPVNRLYTLAR